MSSGISTSPHPRFRVPVTDSLDAKVGPAASNSRRSLEKVDFTLKDPLLGVDFIWCPGTTPKAIVLCQMFLVLEGMLSFFQKDEVENTVCSVG